jgi:hypothetical protein
LRLQYRSTQNITFGMIAKKPRTTEGSSKKYQRNPPQLVLLNKRIKPRYVSAKSLS